jgi:hypothetical protein
MFTLIHEATFVPTTVSRFGVRRFSGCTVEYGVELSDI